ncbi:YtpR family tRNA-binding protein [Catellicoccus marimammalium]|nr:DUF4479 domain-containing protein [Catellicoccus marimammalium]
MIFSFNEAVFGDCLMVLLQNASDQPEVKAVGNVVALYNAEGEVSGYNFFNIKKLVPSISGKKGQVFPTDSEIDQLNALLFDCGFTTLLDKAENRPHIVTGFVKTCVDHPDSDHLHITEVEVADGKVLQIVCGAPNIEAGQTVVVATPGSMMPDGTCIWPGELRGVPSSGMICSAKELHLENAPKERGILVLPKETQIGVPFTASMVG